MFIYRYCINQIYLSVIKSYIYFFNKEFTLKIAKNKENYFAFAFPISLNNKEFLESLTHKYFVKFWHAPSPNTSL